MEAWGPSGDNRIKCDSTEGLRWYLVDEEVKCFCLLHGPNTDSFQGKWKLLSPDDAIVAQVLHV